MDTGDKLIALTGIIFTFAQNQFQENEIQPTMAAVTMEAVLAKFKEYALNEMIAKKIAETNKTAEGNEEREEA